MTNPEVIYLQPPCDADPDTGRMWCEDDSPVDCECVPPCKWVKYIRADKAEQKELLKSSGAQ